MFPLETMMNRRTAAAIPAALLILGALAWGQRQEEPYEPTAVELDKIRHQSEALSARVAALRTRQISADRLADVEIHAKALEWMLRYPEEIYRRSYLHDALSVAAWGNERADAIEKGDAPWLGRTGTVVHGYRSRVDGSVQPFAVHVPPAYDGTRPLRLDVLLHGRNARLSEVSFIASHTRGPAAKRPGHLVVEVFGRTNNAYRWAGETDVFEAIEAVRRNYLVDDRRIVLRGFSMGGAGAWHLGLHHPDKWAVVEAGAGFTDTLEYAKGSLPDGLAGPWQRPVLHIYDAVDYAVNAYNMAVVGYGGEDDAQLRAAENIREALTAGGARFTRDGLDWSAAEPLRALFLVGPGTGHRWHPASQRKSDAFLDKAAERGRRTPGKLRFVTYTTKYPDAFWVRVDGLERFYSRAEVNAERDGNAMKIDAENVSRLVISGTAWAERVEVGGERVELPAFRGTRLFLGRADGRWRAFESLEAARGAGLVKRPGLQGPIDDAFTQPFLVVEPAGEPFHPAIRTATAASLERFKQEFAKWMRADVRIKKDIEVSESDIAAFNLIVFGDPQSNKLLSRILGDLPIEWTAGSLAINGQSYDPRTHFPALIYPNPLNPERYIVLNSGHTFGEAEFRGTNALLFSRWGDWAAVEARAGQVSVKQAGLFNESWEF